MHVYFPTPKKPFPQTTIPRIYPTVKMKTLLERVLGNELVLYISLNKNKSLYNSKFNYFFNYIKIKALFLEHQLH